MSDNRSLGARLKEDLMSNLSISVVSVILAVVALFVFAQIGDPTTGGLFLALNIGVFIPYAYER
jgi:acetyl-CoA carboxylase beta subunit